MSTNSTSKKTEQTVVFDIKFAHIIPYLPKKTWFTATPDSFWALSISVCNTVIAVNANIDLSSFMQLINFAKKCIHMAPQAQEIAGVSLWKWGGPGNHRH